MSGSSKSVWSFAANFDAFLNRKNPLNETQIFDVKNAFNIPKQQERKSALMLNAIFNGKAKIGGKWYKVGDEFDSYKLLKIGKNSVTVRDLNGEFELKTTENEFLKSLK